MRQADYKRKQLFTGVMSLGMLGVTALVVIRNKIPGDIILQALAFAFAVAVVVGGTYAVIYQLRHKKLLKKFASFSEAENQVKGGWLAAILSLLVAFFVSNLTSKLLEYFV